MIGAAWELWHTDPLGGRLRLLEPVAFSLALVEGAVGSAAVSLGDVDPTLFGIDDRLEFWRRPAGGGSLERIQAFFVRKISPSFGADGPNLELVGFDPLYLLDGRIVAYAAGTSQASKNDYVGDMMKAIVAENLGASAADADRQLDGVGLSVAADLADGPIIDKSFAWRNVLLTLQELRDAAAVAGDVVYFSLTPSGTGFVFETHADQLGADRTTASATPVLFSLEAGNLAQPELVMDYTAEAAVSYGGGQGWGEERQVVEIEDTDRSSRSPWARREIFRDSRNETTALAVQAAAQAALQGARPRLRFAGQLSDAPGSRYGLDWRFGDRVSASYAGYQFNAMIRAVTFVVNQRGEDIRARLEASIVL